MADTQGPVVALDFIGILSNEPTEPTLLDQKSMADGPFSPNSWWKLCLMQIKQSNFVINNIS